LARFPAGTIVIVDWRGDALPKEPNKIRPAVIVEDEYQVAPSWPNTIVVPLTGDEATIVPGLSVAIDPTPENGCSKRCYASALSVATVSLERVRDSPSRITDDQLNRPRTPIAETIGIG
jgi:mRNA interferase MazF